MLRTRAKEQLCRKEERQGNGSAGLESILVLDGIHARLVRIGINT